MSNVTSAAGPPRRLVRPMVVLAVCVVGLVVLVLWREGPNPFVLTQWAFTYADGLYRRALAGSVFRWLGGSGDDQVALVGVLLYLATVVVVAVTVARVVIGRQGVRWRALAPALVVVASPAGIPFLAANIAKFDTPSLLLALLGVGAVRRLRGSVRLVVITLLLAVVVGLHEAGLLMVAVPVCALLAVQLEREGTARPLVVAAGPLVVVTAVTALVSLGSPALTPADLAARLAGRTDLVIPLVATIPYRSVAENVRLVGEWVGQPGHVAALLADIGVMVPALAVCVTSLREAGITWSRLTRPERVLLLSGAAPLLLCLVGTDVGRWTSFAVLATCGATLDLLVARDTPGRPSWRVWTLVGVCLVLTALAGGTTSHALWWT